MAEKTDLNIAPYYRLTTEAKNFQNFYTEVEDLYRQEVNTIPIYLTKSDREIR